MKHLLLIALAVLPAMASAQGFNCALRETVVDRLTNKYGESQKSLGIAANGHVIETWASPSGSWTIFATKPSGLACIIASGQSFTIVDKVNPASLGAPL